MNIPTCTSYETAELSMPSPSTAAINTSSAAHHRPEMSKTNKRSSVHYIRAREGYGFQTTQPVPVCTMNKNTMPSLAFRVFAAVVCVCVCVCVVVVAAFSYIVVWVPMLTRPERPPLINRTNHAINILTTKPSPVLNLSIDSPCYG